MLLQGNQGQSGKQVGQNLTVGLGETSEVLITELQPKYYQQNYRGIVFSAQYSSAALAAAAAASTFVLANPSGSGKNLVIFDAFAAITGLTAQAAGTAIVIGGVPQQTFPISTVGTAVVPASGLIGKIGGSIALAYQTATLASVPTAIRQLAALYGDLAASDVFATPHDDIAGAIILQPGTALAIFGLGGTPADVSIQPSITWMEIPV
jgi:hypothetical protein